MNEIQWIDGPEPGDSDFCVVYKIRRTDTGEFKIKRKVYGSAWSKHGDIYSTIGIARGALTCIKKTRENKDIANFLEIVKFQLIELDKF